MTTYKSIIKLFLVGFVAFNTACTANYLDFNNNDFEATDPEMDADSYKIRAALVGMQSNVLPVSINTFQFTDCLLGGSYGGYLSDSNDGWKSKYSTYNPEEHWIQVAFNDIISKIHVNYTLLKAATDKEIPLSIGRITRIAALHRVTDIYGPIPYSKVGEDGKLTAPFDSQEEIYKSMIAELTECINILTENRTQAISPKADKIYAGDLVKWVKLANSLKLRLGMRMAYADPVAAQKAVEEVATHEIGPILATADIAYMSVDRNPYRVIMYEYTQGDSRVGADITTYMNGYEDPRRAAYFTKTTFGGSITDGYFGLRSGIQVPTGDIPKKYSNMVVSTNSKLMWFNAAESAFLLSEGALRGWNVGGSAEEFYTRGVKLSFEQWNVSGADTYLADETKMPAAYKDPQGAFNYNGLTSSITIKWSDSDDTETKLERLITQKWIANFPLGHEAWSEFRRTGYPKLMEVVSNLSGGTVDSKMMARRLPYPQTEYTENGVNLNYAIKNYLKGPDNMGTRMWWDCKR